MVHSHIQPSTSGVSSGFVATSESLSWICDERGGVIVTVRDSEDWSMMGRNQQQQQHLQSHFLVGWFLKPCIFSAKPAHGTGFPRIILPQPQNNCHGKSHRHLVCKEPIPHGTIFLYFVAEIGQIGWHPCLKMVLHFFLKVLCAERDDNDDNDNVFIAKSGSTAIVEDQVSLANFFRGHCGEFYSSF